MCSLLLLLRLPLGDIDVGGEKGRGSARDRHWPDAQRCSSARHDGTFFSLWSHGSEESKVPPACPGQSSYCTDARLYVGRVGRPQQPPCLPLYVCTEHAWMYVYVYPPPSSQLTHACILHPHPRSRQQRKKKKTPCGKRVIRYSRPDDYTESSALPCCSSLQTPTLLHRAVSLPSCVSPYPLAAHFFFLFRWQQIQPDIIISVTIIIPFFSITPPPLPLFHLFLFLFFLFLRMYRFSPLNPPKVLKQPPTLTRPENTRNTYPLSFACLASLV